MKTKQLLSKTLSAAMFAAAMLFGSSAVFAQVKIGTNPTAIEATSNLEVEGSTAGRKVKVDKTTGQVTIADGTQGAGKVLTSDANGGASWQTQGTGCASFEAVRPGAQAVPINDDNGQPHATLIASSELYDPAGAYNPATGQYTVPVTGFYAFKGSSSNSIPLVLNATRNSTILIISAQKGLLASSVVQQQVYNNGSQNSISSMNYLTAGDIITFRNNVVHQASGPKPAQTINESGIQFSGSRIDCNKN